MPLSICVYCSSSKDLPTPYKLAARELGTLLGRRGHTLIFGGNDCGLMGILAAAVSDAGGKAVGIIPQFMLEQGLGCAQVNQVLVASDMRQRKALMAEGADAFIALPGGLGTLEELFETLTFKHLGLHRKPVVLVNTLDYYDPLVAMLEQMSRQGFIKPSSLGHYRLTPTPAQALAWIEDSLRGCQTTQCDSI